MAVPEDGDHGEADNERNKLRSHRGDGLSKGEVARRGRRAQIENQQGQDDGENAVEEGVEASAREARAITKVRLAAIGSAIVLASGAVAAAFVTHSLVTEIVAIN